MMRLSDQVVEVGEVDVVNAWRRRASIVARAFAVAEKGG